MYESIISRFSMIALISIVNSFNYIAGSINYELFTVCVFLTMQKPVRIRIIPRFREDFTLIYDKVSIFSAGRYELLLSF